MKETNSASHAYSRCALNLFVYLLLSMFLPIIPTLMIRIITDSETLSMNASLLCSFIPMYLLGFPLYLLMSKNMETTAPEQHKMKLGHFIIALIISQGIMVTGNLVGTILNAILSLLMPDMTVTSLNSYVFSDSPYLFLFFAIICAPIVEEMLFRKVFIDRVRKFGDGWAILLSGILFGLLHGNFTQFFYAAGLGCFLAFIYVKTGKVRYTIAMHMILNFFGSAMPALLLGDMDLDALMNADNTQALSMLVDMVPLLIYSACSWMVAIAGIVLFFCSLRKLELDPPIQKTNAKSVFCNIGLPLFFLGCVAMFVINML